MGLINFTKITHLIPIITVKWLKQKKLGFGSAASTEFLSFA
jgi:hypothetical protein